MRSRLLIPVAACLALTLPAGAGAATFGSDLALPVTNTTLTCNNAFPFAPNAGSCLAYSVVPSSYAPMSGVVTAVRVKTADVPQGPMQVVVLRSFYQNNLQNPGTPNFFCCFLEKYGPTFTPARNAVTTVPAALGMLEDPTPAASDGNTVARGDFLALSVLSGTVPLPLNVNAAGSGYTGFYAPAPLAPSTPPAPSPNAITGGQGAFPGYTVMLSADIDPVAAGGGPPVVPPAPAPVPGPAPVAPAPVAPAPGTPTPQRPVTVRPAAGRLLRGAASVPLVCRLTTACAGTLTLRGQPVARGTGRAAASTSRTYGSARFTIPAGATRTIRVTLNAAGRRLVRRRRAVTLYATTRVGASVASVKVTFKRKR